MQLYSLHEKKKKNEMISRKKIEERKKERKSEERKNKSKKRSAKTVTRIPHSMDSTPFSHLRSYH